MLRTLVSIACGAVLAIPVTAQIQPTAAELLQRGIYAQETAGELDAAVKIFRQLVETRSSQREIGAQAQFRLGMTLLEKGDAAAASLEIQRLSSDYPDYKNLIATASTIRDIRDFDRNYYPAIEASLKREAAQQAEHDKAFDFSKTVVVAGVVTQVSVFDSYNWLTVAGSGDAARAVRISLDPVEWSRGDVKTGDHVTVIGAPALDGSGTLQAVAITALGHGLFGRTVIGP